jgi:hypothetical protein
MASVRDDFLDALRSISRNGHEDLAIAWLHAHDVGTLEPDIPDDLKDQLVFVLAHDRVSPTDRYEVGFTSFRKRIKRHERKSVVLLEMMKQTRQSTVERRKTRRN